MYKRQGHARQGSTRAPQWTHGGIVFAPKSRDYSYRVNRKLKRLALKSALSAKAASGDLLLSLIHILGSEIHILVGLLPQLRPEVGVGYGDEVLHPLLHGTGPQLGNAVFGDCLLYTSSPAVPRCAGGGDGGILEPTQMERRGWPWP